MAMQSSGNLQELRGGSHLSGSHLGGLHLGGSHLGGSHLPDATKEIASILRLIE